MFVENNETAEETFDYDVLYQAVYDEDTKMMSKFFDKNYYREREGENFHFEIPWSLLHLAAALNKQKSIHFLISMNADCNKKDKTGRTPKDVAKLLGHQLDFSEKYD
eukprot:gene2201-2375_t